MEGLAQRSIETSPSNVRHQVAILGINLWVVVLGLPAWFQGAALWRWIVLLLPLAPLLAGVARIRARPRLARWMLLLVAPLSVVLVAQALPFPYPPELLAPACVSMLVYWAAAILGLELSGPAAQLSSTPLDPWPQVIDGRLKRGLRASLLSAAAVMAVGLTLVIPLAFRADPGAPGAPTNEFLVAFGASTALVAIGLIIAPGFRKHSPRHRRRNVSRTHRLSGFFVSVLLGAMFYLVYRLAGGG